MMSFKTASNVTFLLLLAVPINALGDQQRPAGRPGERIRVIPYDPSVPLVDRLVAQDDVVVVERDRFPPGIALNSEQTPDAALEHALLHDTIVLAHALVSDGIPIDEGTWIRGVVRGSVVEVVKASTAFDHQPNRVTFWHHDGELFIKNVRVRAGSYPVFDPQSRYLLFLGHDPQRGHYLARAFKINPSGSLTTVMTSRGQTELRTSPLYGLPLDEVLGELRRRANRR